MFSWLIYNSVPQRMPRNKVIFAGSLLFAVMLSLPAKPQSNSGAVVLYEGARLILGDGRSPIDNGAFVVQNGRITAIGPRDGVKVPKEAQRMDLVGKTVIPAMVNVHVHIGYEGYGSWGAANYTPQNVLDHLQREAFYGVGVTQS